MVCTIPGREQMLRECEASVRAQTHTAWECLTLLDAKFEGQSITLNRIAREASGDWLLPFDDDDLMLPGMLASLHAAAGLADICYAPPLVDGPDEVPGTFEGKPPNIPTPALFRASLWRKLGGYDEALTQREDYDLYQRALAAKAEFVRVDERLWIYRLAHGMNKSRGWQPPDIRPSE